MSGILIGNMEFCGPFVDDTSLADEAGVLAIMTQLEDEFELVDVVDSDNVRESYIEEVSRRSQIPTLAAAVYYTPELSLEDRARIRVAVENSIL